MPPLDGPTPTRAFEAANRYLGWGDPGRGLWFVGLEESDYWSKQDVHKYYHLHEWEPATTQRDFAALGRKGERIRHVTARIMSGVSESAMTRDASDRWRWYHDHRLWTQGSRGCQANLYPLGKRSLDAWPEDFKELFGFGPADRDAYLKIVADTRFKELRRSWLEHSPQATICFGKAGWEEFEEVFEVTSVPRILAGGKVRVHDHEHVVLTHFFTRGMTNADADTVSTFLGKDWNVRIP